MSICESHYITKANTPSYLDDVFPVCFDFPDRRGGTAAIVRPLIVFGRRDTLSGGAAASSSGHPPAGAGCRPSEGDAAGEARADSYPWHRPSPYTHTTGQQIPPAGNANTGVKTAIISNGRCKGCVLTHFGTFTE